MFSLALKMLADEEEAKDVVQETFIRVWQRIGDYDTQKSFTTWLYTTSINLLINHNLLSIHPLMDIFPFLGY